MPRRALRHSCQGETSDNSIYRIHFNYFSTLFRFLQDGNSLLQTGVAAAIYCATALVNLKEH